MASYEIPPDIVEAIRNHTSLPASGPDPGSGFMRPADFDAALGISRTRGREIRQDLMRKGALERRDFPATCVDGRARSVPHYRLVDPPP